MPLTKGTRLARMKSSSRWGRRDGGGVSRARRTLHRDIAVKVIHPELVTADSLVVSGGRRVLAALSHPNVANVYELDEVDGTAFLVMELYLAIPSPIASRAGRSRFPTCSGSPARWPPRSRRFTTRHRPPRSEPSNIKVTRDGLVKVLDFGLAKPISERRDATACGHGNRRRHARGGRRRHGRVHQSRASAWLGDRSPH